MNMRAVLAIAGVALLIIGVLVGRYLIPPAGSVFDKELRDSTSGYQYISPLLSCAEPSRTLPGELRTMREEVRTYIESEKTVGRARDVAVYFRDLNNGPWFGVDENEVFSPGSLLKVPVMIGILKMAEEDPNIFNRTIPLTERQAPGTTQRIVSSEELALGQEYTIDRLLQEMIVNSNNDAIYLLDAFLDDSVATQVYTDLGIKFPDGIDYEISVSQYASFFRILYNGTYVDPDLAEEALALLANTAFKDGIIAGVPSGIRVAHKFGERELTPGVEQLHDCGIVYAAGNPYTLCIMTRGDSLSELSGVIAGISQIVYRHMEE